MQKIIISLAIALTLSACAYQMPIQQGNVVTQDKLDRLQPGMDKRQVQFLLGTPLLEDPFHVDRWDYYYSLEPGSNDTDPALRYRLTLYFADERMQRYEVVGQLPEQATRSKAE